MEIKNALVKIVFDPKKKKFRAQPVMTEGWVRFPNELRIEGAFYRVAKLKQGKSGSWIAVGTIEALGAGSLAA